MALKNIPRDFLSWKRKASLWQANGPTKDIQKSRIIFQKTSVKASKNYQSSGNLKGQDLIEKEVWKSEVALHSLILFPWRHEPNLKFLLRSFLKASEKLRAWKVAAQKLKSSWEACWVRKAAGRKRGWTEQSLHQSQGAGSWCSGLTVGEGNNFWRPSLLE